MKYKRWLEDEGFNLAFINDPLLAEVNFKPINYDLVFIGFTRSVIYGFKLYDKLHEISKNVEDTPKEFQVCFMTSIINYKVLAEMHPEL